MVFDDAFQFLGRLVEVTIDRPLGSTHPHWPSLLYTVNYGFLEGTLAPDGEGLDAYVLGVTRPVARYTGRCIAVIRRLDDQDDKLIVVPDGMEVTDDEIREATRFQEQYFESRLHRGQP